MSLNYDPLLKSMLPINNGGDIVLNPLFRDWEAYIAENLNSDACSCGEFYERNPDRELLSLCRYHETKYRSLSDADETILFTHPFCLNLSYMDCIDDVLDDGVVRYLDAFSGLINSDRDPEDVRLIVLETPHHYAALTSILLEKGLIDAVIFTRYNSGRPIEQNELSVLNDNSLYIGGAYNGRCLKSSIASIRVNGSPERIRVVKDWVLNSPQKDITFSMSSEIPGAYPSEIISSDQALVELNLKLN